ncbi:unnamed protein product [Effrenium voratum]|uniref:Uncharacterized protein n=1 Tax=Effrenium voratum TaxID=2562239 RepID=A0AA36IJW3_9DINO|nr:unnamed protein product [Effrenium voratum]CAJ1388088.1 unnamed protein product [Effrenium voratum]
MSPTDQWQTRFASQEVWVLNTHYMLFGPYGPRVALQGTHKGRFDELLKCLAVAPPNAAVRLFWADAVVSMEGDELSHWMRFVGKNAPSEQQMARFLWPNIYAAWQGHPSFRSLEQAKADWAQCGHDQPTPGVSVWKYENTEGWQDSWTDADPDWPRQPTASSISFYLRKLQTQWKELGQTAVGLLLDTEGVPLRFFSESPLCENSRSRAPQALITVLGGPRGISQAFKAAVQQSFESQGITLLQVSLGPHEEVAHACVAYLRLEDDAGRLRAALTDLLLLGRAGYESMGRQAEATMRRRLRGKRPRPGRLARSSLGPKRRQAASRSG